MALTIQQILTPLTSDQIRATMVATLVSLGVPADQWRKGGVASTMLTIAAMALALASSTVVNFVSAFYLPVASGSGLVVLAQYVYGVTVPSATFATGQVTLTNSGGGNYPSGGGQFAIGAYVVQNPSTKQTYANAAAFSLNAGQTITINVVATNSGSAGNAVPGSITAQITNLIGVAVTNATALIGTDPPNDAAIRLLCLNKLGVLSVRGVRTAYAYAVQTAVNSVTGAPVNINRWAITESNHVGSVFTWVASPSGVTDPNDVTGVATNIEALARPSAAVAFVLAATTVTYAPVISVYVTAPPGTSSATIKAGVDTAIATYLAQYPIGGVTAFDDVNGTTSFRGVFGTGIAGVIGAAVAAAAGGAIVSVKGATDLALTSGQVAVDAVSTTVIVVPPNAGQIK